MNLSELGFDFSNLLTCSIKKKNYILPLVTSILGITFLPIFIVFLILFLLQVELDINGVPTPYGDPTYMNFFSIFLPIMGLVTIVLFVVTILGLFGKPKDYMIIGKDKTNFDTFYYIFNRKRNEYIYLTDAYMIAYNERFKTLREETNQKQIRLVKKQFIFWNEFFDLENYKIKRKKKTTVLKYKTGYGYTKSYSFSNDIHVVPSKITEMISSTSYSRNNIQGLTTYYFEDINRRQQIDIHPEIKKRLTSFI